MAYKIKSKGTTFGTMTPEVKVVNVMEIDLNKVNSPDPLAYSYGYFQGKSGQPISKDKDLASEYIRGFEVGKRERKELLKEII